MTESTLHTPGTEEAAEAEEAREGQPMDDGAERSELGEHETTPGTHWPAEKLGSGCDDIARTPIRDL